MNRKIATLLFSLFVFSLFASAATANLVIDPAKLGILRLKLYPFSPAVAIREFEVGNTYDIPMTIELEAAEDMQNLITFSEQNFTLQPNETKTVEYTVTISEPGYYSGGVLVKAGIGDMGNIGYNAELSVFVYESDLQPYFYVAIAAIVVVVALVLIFFFRKVTKRKRGKKNAI
jgi:hypothetical protein